MKKRIITLCMCVMCTMLLLHANGIVFAQDTSPSPKQEVRAVWVTTVNALDWPKSKDTSEQKRSLREIVSKLHAARFNTIFFQVRGRGDLLCRSKIEPWSDILTGTLGKDPGWDPLQFLIGEAHAQAMEVHAWFNTFFVRSGKTEAPLSVPRHVMLDHPEWVHTIEGQSWLDPGIPAVRNYVVRLAMELLRNYDVDGIQFDFIRYPGTQFPDELAYRKYGGGKPKDDWRRENITKFVHAVYDSATAMKPWIKVGSAPIGIYTNIGATKGLQGFSELFQDSRAWLKDRIHDYVAPQVYWSLGEQRADPDFRTVAKDWSEHAYGRHVYVGVGAYKPEVHSEIPELIDISRALGAEGNSFFRYENVVDVLGMGGRYSHPANIPEMPWKNMEAPGAPASLSVESTQPGIYHLRWNGNAPVREGNGAYYFNVYRSGHTPVDRRDPSSLIAILPSGTQEFTDTITEARSPKYNYAVSALDRGNNESREAAEQSVVIPEIANLSKRFDVRFGLESYYSSPSNSTAFFRYEVGAAVPVFLKILNQSNEEVLTVVDAIQKPGAYVAAADLSKLRSGTYTYMLIAGEVKEKRTLVVK